MEWIILFISDAGLAQCAARFWSGEAAGVNNCRGNYSK